eukprot:TRINITY_DN5806_c0_g2_i1.p2 TRINITY_DN5806_c0_g2~~TRINITY_DN5806_c0_g2_i1.p2  ORF type:complete len:148 (-),score=59.58 TRINITY_DN5806_c0_g2_i1:46-489(-)
MIVYKDIFTDDEFGSDAFKMKEVEDVAYELEAKFLTKEVDGESVTVIDVVDAHELQRVTLEKKDFVTYIKGFMKKLSDHLKEKSPTRVEAFQKGATKLVTTLVAAHKDLEFYAGSSGSLEGGIAILQYKGEIPVIYIFKDALKIEKY